MPDWTREIRARLDPRPDDAPSAAPDPGMLQELADHLQDRYDALRAGGATHEDAFAATIAELDDRVLPHAAASNLASSDLASLDLASSDLAPPDLAPSDLAGAWRAAARDAHRDAHRRTPSIAGAVEPLPPGVRGPRRLVADLWRDLRYGARMLRKAPAFTAIAVLTLGLGIGANTTVFTIINTILLSSLPVGHPETLVTVNTIDRKDGSTGAAQGAEGGSGGDNLLPISHLNLKDLQAQNDVFSSLSGHSAPLALTLLDGNAPERIFAELVTANYFETLDLQPVRGRFFRADEDRTPGTHPVGVIGYALWQQRFGGAPDIIGRTLRINRVAFTVIGVAPEGFKGVNVVFGPDIWIPSMMTEQVVPAQSREWLRDRGQLAFRGTGRLKPGVTLAQAESGLQAIAASLARDYPDANRGRTLRLQPLERLATTGSGAQGMVFGLAVLMAIVGLILLIACSNVANLLLARGAARRQEVALRLALGAGRLRLVRQLVTESVLLGIVSGIVGIAIAYGGTRLLWSFRPPEVARNLIDVTMDVKVLVFGLVVSALTGLIFGAAPAWQSSRADLVDALKEEARTAGRSRRRVTLGRVLLVGQVTLSMVSLVTAGLCLRAMQRAYAIDPGFETERLAVLMMSPGQAGYDQPRSEEFLRDARARVAGIPGVTSVSWATNLPLWARPTRSLFIEGRDEGPNSTGLLARGVLTIVNTVDLDYFTTTGIRLQRGRDFTDADRDGSLPVAVINETMAEKYWPNQEAIGKRFRFGGETAFREIVGVVRTANYQELGESPQPCVYLPLRQNFSDAVVLYVRTAADPAPVLSTVQREVRTLEPLIEVSDVRTIQKVISQALFGATMGVGLLGVFGFLGLGLASLGLYGVMAYSVNLRQREIGVRMALGAGRASVLGLVLREGLTLVGAGIVAGIGASLLVGRALARLLYGVSPLDPLSLAGAAIALVVAAALACYLPARRASRLDPLIALRDG